MRYRVLEMWADGHAVHEADAVRIAGQRWGAVEHAEGSVAAFAQAAWDSRHGPEHFQLMQRQELVLYYEGEHDVETGAPYIEPGSTFEAVVLAFGWEARYRVRREEEGG